MLTVEQEQQEQEDEQVPYDASATQEPTVETVEEEEEEEEEEEQQNELEEQQLPRCSTWERTAVEHTAFNKHEEIQQKKHSNCQKLNDTRLNSNTT